MLLWDSSNYVHKPVFGLYILPVQVHVHISYMYNSDVTGCLYRAIVQATCITRFVQRCLYRRFVQTVCTGALNMYMHSVQILVYRRICTGEKYVSKYIILLIGL